MDKIIIIGASSIGDDSYIHKLINEGKAEIISIEQAKENGYNLSSRLTYDYPAPLVVELEPDFKPPITRTERRKKDRNLITQIRTKK